MTQHKRAHDQRRTYTIIITTATTACNIRLMVVTIITSHTGMAYHIARRRTTVSVYW